MEKDHKQYPEGHFVGMWMGIGIALFTGLGIPLAIVVGNPAFMGIGPALGVSCGLAIGASIEEKYKKEGRIRPLTEAEKKRRSMGVLAGVVSLVVLSLLLLFFFLLRT